MAKYILKRIGISLVTIWILATITFFLMHAVPGDPFSDQKRLPPEVIENLNAYYGLDKSLVAQYFTYMGNLVRGDLGYSMEQQSRTVNSIIAESFPYSAHLGIQSLIFGITIGLTLGILAALHHNKSVDYVTMVIAVLGVSVPNFIIGALLQYFFGVKWQVFPVAQWKGFIYTVLPTIALGSRILASQARMIRATTLEVLQQDYIKTAKAKGLGKGAIVWKHTIRNAILPIITSLGPLIATILTGTFVIENIFAIPGLGKYFVLGVQNLDYPVILGTTIFYGSFLVFLNLLIDIAYGLIDPRIKVTQ
ncbi:ABC transporter permease [Garciella nitratireducens]|uniref:Oligopeptide transport system permease protein n=1 Tax=Garciella nitratireducens DSM 15102 TaxID=1121911 RepID=A0A1T4NAW5_9FIRM|nr:ABC transporter permease [Garciella nitratireducens]RBP37242.1 oligopeptide transport system permease protein [Garciella nitratireducens]SJZ76411.1 oligopeptide transport system permease protein [Garciella nitratireducens DSM 15102]